MRRRVNHCTPHSALRALPHLGRSEALLAAKWKVIPPPFGGSSVVIRRNVERRVNGVDFEQPLMNWAAPYARLRAAFAGAMPRSLRAAARASSVTVAPESMRAISSMRSSAESAAT